ncbi:uncharacterized protein LOC124264695 [Haliotis rubra]|uniref:uncharacterized protein LOC124264695 n=1 Tax=Haliotis rubra TaxID=36100 RepID=UPI001EE56B8F|nr:uncharacterized protein LOC124264695 [Haliotis rubra]
MKELLSLLQLITVNLSESYMNNSECLPFLPEGDDALWRRLVAVPDDPSNDEMSLKQIHDELMVGVSSSEGITSSEVGEDANTEDVKTGRQRSRNRQKRKSRRNVSSVDNQPTAPCQDDQILPEINDSRSNLGSAQPLDLSVTSCRSRSKEEDPELTPVPQPQYPRRPRADSPMPRGGTFGTGLDHGYSYAVAYSPTKRSSTSATDASACDVSRTEDVPARKEYSQASVRNHAYIGLPAGSHIRVTSSTDTEGCVHPSFQTEESELGTDVPPVQCLFPAYAKPAHDHGVNMSQEADSAIVPDFSQSIASDISHQRSHYTSPADNSGYASPDSMNDRSLSNVFEGIHISPSDKSVHSFTSTFSDNYSHLGRDTTRVYKHGYRGIAPGRNVHNTSDQIVSGDLDEQSFLTRSFMLDDIPNLQSEPSFLSFASHDDTSRCSEHLGREFGDERLKEVVFESPPKQSTPRGADVETVGHLGRKGSMVKGRKPSTGSKSKEVELDVIAAPEISVTNILILTFVILFVVGVCLHLKATGLTALLEYYSWWEILYKNIDVTKMGDTLF